MTSTAAESPEVRTTEWVEFGHYGYTHYRIWTSQTAFTKLQRHEWRNEDGTTVLDDWINVPCPRFAA